MHNTLVGHSCETLARGTLVGHSCGTLLWDSEILWDTLVIHSCGALLRDTVVKNSCRTLLRGTCVGHSCRKDLWDTLTLAGHSWDTFVGHSCRALLSHALAGHSCVAHSVLQGRPARVHHKSAPQKWQFVACAVKQLLVGDKPGTGGGFGSLASQPTPELATW